MLTKRIIPCLDVNNGRVVKGINFVQLRDAGDPVECGEAYSRAGADELVFLDITATSDRRETVADMVRRVAECVFIPFTVGGGIRTVDDMMAILREGADKISVNSAAVKRPELIAEGAERFGSQCIVLAIDAKRRVPGLSPEESARLIKEAAASKTAYGIHGTADAQDELTRRMKDWTPDIGWTVYVAGGRQDTGIDAIEWARRAEALGAGEMLVTSMDCDGTKAGYDIELTRTIAEEVKVPVIASGGAGTKEHFYDALTDGKADAALAASLFHFKELEISEVKEYLKGRGVSVRI